MVSSVKHTVLVTGGAGYVGSHTVVALLEHNYGVVIVDNFSNSSRQVIQHIEKISNKKITYYDINCCDEFALEKVFSSHKIDSVIHFAGLKAVGESVSEPLKYYKNNLLSTIVLCKLMKKYQVNKLLFSSSATVYGIPKSLPIHEDHEIGRSLTNPYGKTKYMIEEILLDLKNSDKSWDITILRYFNPIGAHESGLIGENPNGVPNNLMPYITQVAVGKLDKLKIFGSDYETRDGTGIRDYIHVMDLAEGHLAALANNQPNSEILKIYNLGIGVGTSVLELVEAFESATGIKIDYEFVERRPGDIAEIYADCTKANREINWFASRTIKKACEDAWKWQSMHPNGY